MRLDLAAAPAGLPEDVDDVRPRRYSGAPGRTRRRGLRTRIHPRAATSETMVVEQIAELSTGVVFPLLAGPGWSFRSQGCGTLLSGQLAPTHRPAPTTPVRPGSGPWCGASPPRWPKRPPIGGCRRRVDGLRLPPVHREVHWRGRRDLPDRGRLRLTLAHPLNGTADSARLTDRLPSARCRHRACGWQGSTPAAGYRPVVPVLRQR